MLFFSGAMTPLPPPRHPKPCPPDSGTRSRSEQMSEPDIRLTNSDTGPDTRTVREVFGSSWKNSSGNILRVQWLRKKFLANTGIPPFNLIRCVHLSLIHFRITTTQLNTLPALMFTKLNSPLPLSSLHPNSCLPHPVHNLQIQNRPTHRPSPSHGLTSLQTPRACL